MRNVLIALLALLALLALSAITLGAVGGRVYRNPALRVQQLELPRGWDSTPPSQIAYPRVVVLASFGAARMTFAVQRVVVGTSAEVIAAEARAQLLQQGYRDVRISPDGDRARLEATLDGGKQLVRQVYIVDGDLAFVLTIVLPADRRERWLREFEDTLRSLVITPAVGAPSPPP